MTITRQLLFLFLALLLHNSSLSSQDLNLGKQTQKNNEAKGYTLGPEDIVTIKVYDNPDLSGDFKISPDGSIVFPILGPININGLETIEVQKLLFTKLEKDYLYDPIVSVEVKEYKSKIVYILGNIDKSGIYHLTKPTRLFDLLSEANVLSKDVGKLTNGNNVRIIRQKTSSNHESNKDTTFIISLYHFLNNGNKDLNISMQDGDIVYIPNTRYVHVIGEVKKPGSFNFEENMTVLKAISLAGGRTNTSSQRNIYVKRIINNKETRLKVKMGDSLKPDDIIEIPLSVW